MQGLLADDLSQTPVSRLYTASGIRPHYHLPGDYFYQWHSQRQPVQPLPQPYPAQHEKIIPDSR